MIILYIYIVQSVIIFSYLLYVLYFKLRLSAIKKLRYERSFSSAGVFEGDHTELTETIYNGSIFPLFHVDVESYIYNELHLTDYMLPADDTNPAMQLIVSRFHLMPFMMIKRTHKIKCVRRSHVELETVCIYCRKQAVYFNAVTELYVYPKITDLNDNSFPVNFRQGTDKSKYRMINDPFLISGIRDYASGDPFNQINFKATAKNNWQNLKVNNLDFCSDRIFMFYINFAIPAGMTIPTDIYENIMEQSLSYTASFIKSALYNGYKVGFAANCHLTNGERYVAYPITGGTYYIEDILKEIAKIRISGTKGISFTSLLDKSLTDNIYNTEVFIFTFHMDSNISDKIETLKTRNNAVNIIKLGI